MAENSLAAFILAIVLGYVYAFVGGFTDAANAIATSVGTRVLRPRTAVIMAGVFNLLGGLTGTAVAVTIGKGIVDPRVLSLTTVVAGLVGAMSWSLLTYFLGIPVSETHGLIGGLVGAAVATAGWDAVETEGLRKVPGGHRGVPSDRLCRWNRPHRHHLLALPPQQSRTRHAVVRQPAASVRRLHGFQPRTERRPETDGCARPGDRSLPRARSDGFPWIIVSAALVAAIGTAFGGWRIIRTLGVRVTKLDPVQGFAAEVSAATVIQVASNLGIPISTTQAITSSVVGVGASRRLSAVRWGVTSQIFLAWVLTVPAAMGMGALWVLVLRPLVGG